MEVVSDRKGIVRQLTQDPHGHILTNTQVWSRDSRYLVFDVRSDAAGTLFDGDRIEAIDVEQGTVELLYRAQHGAHCGVATCSPNDDRVVFILGPEHPTPDWQYAAYHRRGVLASRGRPGFVTSLDAVDIVEPYTPGALRGGTHVHVFDPSSDYVSFTYEDHVLATSQRDAADPNQRNVGVCRCDDPVHVPSTHPRNQDGSAYAVLVTKTVRDPTPGSDEISKAYEDAWLAVDEGLALAYLGDGLDSKGRHITELFKVTFPKTWEPSGGPLQGTIDRRPFPPRGCIQQRLTHTEHRKFPGIRGPRHWPRSHPSGKWIATLMLDDVGNAQMFLVDPKQGDLHQVTQLPFAIESCFSWSPDGEWISFIADGSVMMLQVATTRVHRLTTKRLPGPRPEACVFSPDGAKIAYVCVCLDAQGRAFNQLFMVEIA